MNPLIRNFIFSTLFFALPCFVAEVVADPTAAPVPDHERGQTATPQTPGRLAALRRWNEAKFGLFLHWGPYSVYSGSYQGKDLWSAEWIQENARIPYSEYAKTAANWNPADFDADVWVRTAKEAGMRYIVITAKHHDGFAIYPSKADRYHLFTSGAYKGPDPLAALKTACARHGLLFGIYYSPLEFRGSPKGFDEEDEKAVAEGFDYRTLGPKPYATRSQIAAKAKAQIQELVTWYRPDILWFDGTWNKMGVWTESDARNSEILIRSVVPNVVINNRLGVKTADFNTYENEIPATSPDGRWEYCWNMGAFWGYNPRNYTPDVMKTPEHYIETLVRIASLGGNYLLNVGPEPTGKLPPMAVDYLQKIGSWVNPNRQAIEGVSPSPFAEKPYWGYVTSRDGKLYLIVNRSLTGDMRLSLPALENKLLRAYSLRDSAKTPVAVKTTATEWLFSTPTATGSDPFSVLVLEVEGRPVARTNAGPRITYRLADGFEQWPADKRAQIVNAMTSAVEHYNQHGDFQKSLTVHYNPDVPTAHANIDGYIAFGGAISTRVALHEMAHTLGSGTHPNWKGNIKDGIWTGQHTLRLIREFDGPKAVLHADSMHFWPYGLNYDHESSAEIDVRHVKIVAALLRDMEAPAKNTRRR